MSIHAWAVAKESSLGEIRTTGPYLVWRSATSHAILPFTEDIIEGSFEAAHDFGPGNLERG